MRIISPHLFYLSVKHLGLLDTTRWDLVSRIKLLRYSLYNNPAVEPRIKPYPEHYPKPLNPPKGRPFGANFNFRGWRKAVSGKQLIMHFITTQLF